MPRAAHVCPVLGCTKVTRDRYCADHLRERRQIVDANRPTAAQRGYDEEWRQTRAAFLRENPYCGICGQKATEPDHIIPIADGGTNDWENLRPRCKRHHSQRTAREGGGFGNPKGEGR